MFLALCYRVMIHLERSKINQEARVARRYTWGSYLFSLVISKLATYTTADTFNLTRWSVNQLFITDVLG